VVVVFIVLFLLLLLAIGFSIDIANASSQL